MFVEVNLSVLSIKENLLNYESYNGSFPGIDLSLVQHGGEVFEHISVFRKEEIRIREEEDKLMAEILHDLQRNGKQKIVSFSWTRCWLETCLIGQNFMLGHSPLYAAMFVPSSSF